MTTEEMDLRFTYHSPKGTQPAKYETLRTEAGKLAWLINEYCPDCRETALAFTKLEEAVMWANSAIARRTAE